MDGIFKVTKAATAYVELEADEVIDITASLVRDVKPVPGELEIGQSVIYFWNGTSMNVRESVGHIQSKIQRHINNYGFSKN